MTTTTPSTNTTTTTTTNNNNNNNNNSYHYNYTNYTNYIIPIYIGYRIWLSNRMPITDCDEVYNYWEPLHYLIFNKGGFQTWEYSNQYALRTYAYLLPLLTISKVYLRLVIPYVIPNWIWPLLSSDQITTATTITTIVVGDGDQNNVNKVALFVLLRATLATFMAISELSFCKSIIDLSSSTSTSTSTSTPTTTTSSSSSNITLIGYITGLLMITSAGMGHSSGALLPSSTIMMLWLFATSEFLKRRHLMFTMLAIIATLCIGWPFGVLMFIPQGITILLREYSTSTNNLLIFVSKIIVITIIVQSCVMLIDKQQYGDWVSPTYNIFMYNTKSGGDELYGIEPLTYYIKNLILNFNLISVVGILSGLPLLVYYVVMMMRNRDSQINGDLLIVLLPMYIWIGIVFPRPHKEERFLFPIYPAMCLGSAMVSVTFIDLLLMGIGGGSGRIIRKVDKNIMRKRSLLFIIQGMIWLPSIIFSFSRTIALSKYYTAPLYVYAQLSQNLSPDDIIDSTICTCGEWYRFPSSFYLPSNINKFGFVQSSFEGQLPQLFQPNIGSNDSTNHFNDQNLPEPKSYTSIDDCDYLIDLWTSNDCRENDSIWKPIVHESFLNADMTSSTLHRALYIPYLHESAVAEEGTRVGSVVYVDYILYQRQPEQEQQY